MPPRRRLPPRSPELAALGEALRTVRLRVGVSQERLAEMAGTDLTQVGGIERGTRNPTFLTLVRLADALGVTVGQIASLADEVEAPPPDGAPDRAFPRRHRG